jgi:hypothetical protein
MLLKREATEVMAESSNAGQLKPLEKSGNTLLLVVSNIWLKAAQ